MGAYNVSCFEKLPGETLEDADGSVSIAFGYGRTLGEMHNASAAYPFAEERRDYRELMEEIGERFGRYRAPDCVLRLYDETARALEALNRDETVFGLIHYDFEPDNVLYDERTDTFGIIDFDDAIRCWYALDLARAIDAMDDVVDEDMVEGAVCAFFKGYRSVRAFSDEQAHSLPLMRRLVALQEYATILHVLSDEVEEEPDWLLRVRKTLRNRQNEIENTYEREA